MNKTSAQQACEEKSAHLVWIFNAAKQACLETYLGKYNYFSNSKCMAVSKT